MAIARGCKLVARAFHEGQPPEQVGGLASTGDRLMLYGNVIAEWRTGEGGERELWVRVNGIERAHTDTRGWRLTGETRTAMARGDFEHNPTTLGKLNLVPSVNVGRSKGRLCLNGQAWDGRWTKIVCLS